MKALDAELNAVAKKTLWVIDGKEGKEVGVFLFLYCQMWLQMFSQPELAREMLGELAPVYDKWSKGDKKGSEAGEEPAWVEVLTEILISLLAQNNHLLRGVVGARVHCGGEGDDCSSYGQSSSCCQTEVWRR